MDGTDSVRSFRAQCMAARALRANVDLDEISVDYDVGGSYVRTIGTITGRRRVAAAT